MRRIRFEQLEQLQTSTLESLAAACRREMDHADPSRGSSDEFAAAGQLLCQCLAMIELRRAQGSLF